MPDTAKNKFVISNTPGTIFKDLIVMPLRLSESFGAPPGDVMAFNIVTGAVEWVFHTIPEEDEVGSSTWGDRKVRQNTIIGAANNWTGMAVDEEAEIIYVPTGSAAPDFYGGIRKGINLFSNCLLALDANTGERLWHFQFVHHDLWDRDLPAPPNLLTIERDGKTIPAVAQVTKQGYVFVFDRITGTPLFDIEEVPVPPSTLEGEEAWPTQPIPVKPKPFARQSSELTEMDISPYAENREELLELFRKSDLRMFAPPSLTPSILLPGYGGGAEWGGASADPESGILYVNANELPRIQQMKANNQDLGNMSLGEVTYKKYCATCHQTDRKGSVASGFPSLVDIGLQKEKDEVSGLIVNGKGMMPGFPQIAQKERDALLQYLFNQEEQLAIAASFKDDTTQIPYTHMGYTQFLDSKGLPGTSPPWGSMHAINLNTGEYIWSIVLGETPELLEKGIKGTGCANYGGAVVTEKGLLFIAATRDGYFRAFDKHLGKLLWEYKLPTAAFATPATYEVNGKQYIAIACGGDKFGAKKGNQIIAFAIPN
jgi:quinoprotein glucose dehydrogenase